MFSTIVSYINNNIDFIITCSVSLAFLIVNIIQAICTHNLSKLKEALSTLPQVIRDVEMLACIKKYSSVEKKALAESLCLSRYGKLFSKYSKVFDDAIEDILNTPQKKGGSLDVSQKSEEK